MAKKSTFIDDTKAAVRRAKDKAKGIVSASDTADAIRAAAAARRKDAAVAPVLTSVATKARKGSMLVPAAVTKPQADVLGGTQHLFVNLPPGALFTWDKAANMPGIYVKWSPHFFRKLGEARPGWISPAIAGVQCYYLPENEVARRLEGL